ncbi:hypothetical protein Fot_28869 [Forsythia ovata]|uniref:Uncharacterized protein n=1 Tax=Forsythia ovata TaxID=205694 RepID=A0ABD1TQN0_9LAMI
MEQSNNCSLGGCQLSPREQSTDCSQASGRLLSREQLADSPNGVANHPKWTLEDKLGESSPPPFQVIRASKELDCRSASNHLNQDVIPNPMVSLYEDPCAALSRQASIYRV